MNVKTIENISAGTVSRFVILALALVNQTLTMTGHSPILVDEEGVQQFISLAFMGVTSLWAYWKNNDVTKKARTKGE
ncbi:phage holin [Bacillus haynesii]|uniref:phage holin n=1 Tax=Bacillus haynesii TaxID=1925021 RepID=UPI002282E813|nr:phage holin [Bacillus haynesii]MCY8754844.1 phage holin [Bacillus haynesii]